MRRRRRRTRSVHSGCVGCGSEPRNDELAGAETVLMVERNMCNAVMRGIVVPPGSRATSRAKGSRRKLGYPTSGRRLRVRSRVRRSASGRRGAVADDARAWEVGRGHVRSTSDRVEILCTAVKDAKCRYCCKSPKLPGANFYAVKKSDRRSPVDVASITLPRSPVSLSSGDEVPHIFTPKSRVQPKEILIASAKRLLQQNLPIPD